MNKQNLADKLYSWGYDEDIFSISNSSSIGKYILRVNIDRTVSEKISILRQFCAGAETSKGFGKINYVITSGNSAIIWESSK